MRQGLWVPVLCALLVGLVGCKGEQAEVVELEPVAEAPVAAAEPAQDVVFSEDFENGEAGRWSSVTIVQGGAGGSKYAAQGAVREEGGNPEYWGLGLTVDGELTLRLDIRYDKAPTSVQIVTFAEQAEDNFHLQITELEPGRWHHVQAKVASFSSWGDGSVLGDKMQNINIWVQGAEGDSFRIDNVKLYR